MREADIWVRYRTSTNSNHHQPVFDNRLERDFAVAAPNQVSLHSSPEYTALYHLVQQHLGLARKGGRGVPCDPGVDRPAVAPLDKLGSVSMLLIGDTFHIRAQTSLPLNSH